MVAHHYLDLAKLYVTTLAMLFVSKTILSTHQKKKKKWYDRIIVSERQKIGFWNSLDIKLTQFQEISRYTNFFFIFLLKKKERMKANRF